MTPQTIYDQMIIDDYENVQDFKRRDGITKRYTGELTRLVVIEFPDEMEVASILIHSFHLFRKLLMPATRMKIVLRWIHNSDSYCDSTDDEEDLLHIESIWISPC